MKRHRHVIIIFLAFLVASCSKNNDPVKVLKNHVVQGVKDSYGDKFELVSFEKINATNGEVFGVQVTEIEYKAIFKNPKKLVRDIGIYYDWKYDKEWKPDEYTLGNYMSDCHPFDTITIDKKLHVDGFVIGNFISSDEQKVFLQIEAQVPFERSGKQVLHKTENGWIIDQP